MVENPTNHEAGYDIVIQKAHPGDLEAVWHIIDTCAKNLATQGFTNWATNYSQERVSKMINKLNVYLATRENIAVGTITLSTQDPSYYSAEDIAKFTYSENGSLHVMSLGVLPEYNKQGIAINLLQFAQEQAVQQGLSWLRLDCRAEIPGLIQFYEHRGFIQRGTIQSTPQESYCLLEKHL